ncbi:putative ankyrin repeat protein [Acanthamoeba polyphaga mimivirus]|uniref:Ankyrin repeat protein n=1 Tax=Acanthamoeba polyphaga mimivirus Kroon TaxID=3069720 RepID=A0A0G2Y9H6_9VIRU|nr:putative ankyrin repeat protein [Acanthamoeba polyphaga mimivirus]AKI79761.1 putative ankyrin repeat protein [Acanthamoeba polyphaga mimivirus Kroon]
MDPQIFVNKLPDEIWLHIISFIGESQFDLYFASKEFFRLTKYFRDPINSKKSENLIKQAIIRELPHIVNYILKIIKNNKPEFNNKLFDNLGINEYFRQCVKRNIHSAVDYFISKNIDINAVNEYGKSPLITAIKSGNCTMVEKLIDCGADFNKHEIYKLAFDYRCDDIFVFLIGKKIESNKFYNKIINNYGSFCDTHMDELIKSESDFFCKFYKGYY